MLDDLNKQLRHNTRTLSCFGLGNSLNSLYRMNEKISGMGRRYGFFMDGFVDK